MLSVLMFSQKLYEGSFDETILIKSQKDYYGTLISGRTTLSTWGRRR